MANKTVYPYGTGGQLPSSIGLINDLKTGGADKALAAEQGKVLAGMIDENTEEIFSMFATEINLSSYSEYVGWTIPNNNLWQQVTNAQTKNNYGCKLVPITPGYRYRIYTHTTGQTIAILASNSMVAGSSPDFCEDYDERITVSRGDIFDFIAPEDASYLYMTTKSSGNAQDGTVKYSDGEIHGVNELQGEIDSLQSEINIINSKSYGEDTPVTDKWLIQADGTWAYTSTANAQSCVLIPITPGETYRVVAGQTRGQFYALLASDTKSANATADFCDGETGRRLVNIGMTEDFTAPADAAFCYLVKKSASGTYDGYLAIPKPINEQIAEAGIGTDVRDGFANAPEYYLWLKAEQFTKIKWTPLKGTIQKASATTMFPANTEQTGIPYSSVAEYDKRIGTDVSLHTFMTALHNPYSVMYTECVRSGYSQSAYGRTYRGPANSGPYYGVVCSNYISYAEGIPAPYTTGQLAGLSETGIMSVVYDQSANGVERGDIVWQEGHVMLIKDVWRKNGVVTKVLVSEEAQPQAKDNAVKTAEQFNTWLAQNGRIIYRYNEIFKNIKYEPSPYVAVGEETPQTVTYNDDICTFAGDKVPFAEDDLIYIHCLNLDYPQMELYKGDTLVETITLASDSRATKTSDNLAYAVNLSNDGLTYGKYKCRLKNGSTYSDYTYFEVINAVVTVNGDTATYSSANGKAMYWYWCEYQSNDGQGMFNTSPLPGLSSGTIDVSSRRTGYPLLKVLFRGDYGNIAGKFLEQ